MTMTETPPEARHRQQRSDRGAVRQQPRDVEVLDFLADMYGLPLDLLAAALGVTTSRAYQLVRRWKRARWVQTGHEEAGGPVWVYPTRDAAARFLGWDAGGWAPRPATVAHHRAVAAVRLHLVGSMSRDHWESERRLRHDSTAGERRMKGVTEPHAPDGLHIAADGTRTLLEVELTAKSALRYFDAAVGHGGNGLLPDIAVRAKNLRCDRVAYWATPPVLGHVRVALNRYTEAFKRPAELGRWEFHNIEEVPQWRTGGAK